MPTNPEQASGPPRAMPRLWPSARADAATTCAATGDAADRHRSAAGALADRGWRTPLGAKVKVWGRRLTLTHHDVELAWIALSSAGNGRWRDRAAAPHVLACAPLSADEREKVLARLIEVVNDRGMPQDGIGRLRRWLMRTTAITGPLAVIGAMMFGAGHEPDLAAAVGAFFSILLIFGTAFVGAPLFPLSYAEEMRRIAAVRASAASALASFRAREALRALAAAACERNSSVKAAAMAALADILPLFGDRDYGVVPADIVASLCRAVDEDHAASLAIVAAIGRFGGGSALGAVRRIAQAATSADLRQAAHDALPVLEARAARERAPAVLLRPSITPVDAESTLLRGAASGSAMDEALLLRADGAQDA